MKKVSFFFAGLLLASPLQAALVMDIKGSSKSTIIEVTLSGEAYGYYTPEAPLGAVASIFGLGVNIPDEPDAITMKSGDRFVYSGEEMNLNAIFVYWDESEELGYVGGFDGLGVIDGGPSGGDSIFMELSHKPALGDGDRFSWDGTFHVDLAAYGEDWSMFKEGSYQSVPGFVDIPSVVNIIDLHPGQGHAYGQGGKPKDTSALTSTLFYSVQAVPEPGTSTLLVLTALGLCLRRRR
ncbi:PEP-CTERM protein-sorting domain-containing protein [Rubritalea squalenifaciens DSM 18772]|uniref:PEP-CTERM protein-sorting domain-containing protein n=1 Tax=Rubritalea squalenifaciens DSM 18772 TaxID=1123071 RepID=A0A1M6LZG6_9BACT|nr:PEP-CTERM sorting domain-containing protein [Rubritalea squalenifaciens]SHJ76565.1 PEP-CTERM protein-sorting domain-containing protein [Rubritalea squalenifaciens DSM 18772]